MKKWCQYCNAFKSRFQHRRQEKKKKKRKENIHLLKNTSIHRRWVWGVGGHNYDNYLQQSKMWDQQSSWERAGPWKPEHKSRLTCVSSESRLLWEISGTIWLFSPVHSSWCYICSPQHRAHLKLYTNTQTHVEHISAANGQWDLTKAQLERHSLSKITPANSEALTQVGSVHLWLPGCVVLGRIYIKKQAMWSCDFLLFRKRSWFVSCYRILQHTSMTVWYPPFSNDI